MELLSARRFTLAVVSAGIGLLALPLGLAYASTSVSIQSLSPSTNISVGTNLTFTVANAGFNSPSYSISDSFGGSSVSNSNINSSGNFSWTPGGNDVGTHNFTITVSDSSGDTATTQESVTVSQAPSVSAQSLSPSSSVSTGQTVTFNVVTTGFSNPTYSVSDSFGGTSVSNSDINSSGNFSWTPGSNDVGSHTITVNVTDGSGHSGSASETISVSTAGTTGTTGTGGATIQGLEPGTSVVIGNSVTFTVAASGFTNPVFSVSDSFGGSSVSNSDINSAGYFSWTPNGNDIGTHNITIYVNDPSGHTGNVTLSLTVQNPNITVTSISPGTTVLPNSPLSFTISQAGFVNPSYTLSDSFANSSITNADINSSGSFSWTPANNQSGSHTITVYATDASGHSANTSITVDVNSGVSVALTAPEPNSSVQAGTTVTFEAYAYGFSSPVYSLQDSFSGSSLTSADISSSGNFSWTPINSDVGSHTVTVTVTDPSGRTASGEVELLVGAGSGSAASGSSSTLASLEAELGPLEAQLAAAQQQAQSGSASPTSGFTFQNYLYPGVTSNDVTELQTVLTKEGYFSGPVTGYYGTLTENAVVAFQAAQGLDQLGVVGPATRAALNAILAGSGSTTSTSSASAGDGYVFQNFIGYGDTSTDVTELQQKLTALGIYSGPITGYFGDETQAAVESFQTAHGIQAVGYVGPATRAALNQ